MAVADRAKIVHDPIAHGQQRRKVCGWHFDARDIAVMAHAAVAKTRGDQGVFGALDALE